jgi:hypothetical protein
MASYDVYVTLTLTDANGDTAHMRVNLGTTPDTGTLAALANDTGLLLTALGAPGTITNAKVTSATVSFLYEKAGPSGAVDAEYSGVSDGARLNFLNSQGGRGQVTIPAPVTAVFATAPNENVVDSGGPVAALITFLEAHYFDGSNPLNVYNGGRKVGRHAPRRAQHKVP